MTWEERLSKALSTLGWPVDMSLGVVLIKLVGVGKTQSILGGHIPQAGS